MGIIGLYIIRVIAYLICLAFTASYIRECMTKDIHVKIEIEHKICSWANDLDINMKGTR